MIVAQNNKQFKCDYPVLRFQNEEEIKDFPERVHGEQHVSGAVGGDGAHAGSNEERVVEVDEVCSIQLHRLDLAAGRPVAYTLHIRCSAVQCSYQKFGLDRIRNISIQF
jgi:hypothetical protein